MQRAFCHLLTDNSARESYLADREAYLSRLNLTPVEKTCLSQLDTFRVNAYSRMLINSRVDLALMALPHAKAFLPSDFLAKYGRLYMDRYPPETGTDGAPLLRELRRFVEFLEYLAITGEIGNKQFLDALYYDSTIFILGNDPQLYEKAVAFERNRVETPVGSTLQACRLQKAPAMEIRTFGAGLVGFDPNLAVNGELLQDMNVLFQKRPGKPTVQVYAVSVSTKQFLELCDGTLRLREIAAKITGETVSISQMNSCEKLCRKLLSQGVIGVEGTTPVSRHAMGAD